MCLYGHVTLWVEVTQGKSPSCQVWDHRHCGSGDTVFRLSRDLTKPPDYMVI